MGPSGLQLLLMAALAGVAGSPPSFFGVVSSLGLKTPGSFFCWYFLKIALAIFPFLTAESFQVALGVAAGRLTGGTTPLSSACGAGLSAGWTTTLSTQIELPLALAPVGIGA